ncbi:restriction endonuclease subunit S [Mycoplasmopsis pullorum]|uniref:restriction endonuclease subunit S n=1 Tax=Mycoplasmopsis pullorum TaxID=48003 RepID=UPI0015D5D21F|nr:restriction endonuclease subunit S [Mycoplasmopsis pullorum]
MRIYGKLYKNTIQKHYTKNIQNSIKIKTKSWLNFKIKDIFYLEKGKCNNASSLLEDGDDIYYIGVKKNNNGVMKKVKRNKNLVSRKNALVFICDGEGSVRFHTFQDKEFIASTTLTLGYNKQLNKYNSMFIITALDKNRYKYSYGRKYRVNEFTTLKLPAILTPNNKWEPDWKFMKYFIKQLPYGDVI